MKKKIVLIVLGALLVVSSAIFIYYKLQKGNDAIALLTAKAEYGYIAKTITATGTIQPVDTVSVGAQVSGVVRNVYADFNSKVKQGELLARVDPSIITAQMEQSKANLANMKSNLEFQQSHFDRQKKLYKLGAISQADFQLATNQFKSAQATVLNASAQVRVTEKNLSYTNIYSPINGVVLNRNISEGQTIASSFNAPTLFVIAKDLTKMQVRAAVDEADIGGVRSNQRVTFTVDAFPDDLFQGMVQSVLLHPTVTSNVVTYATLINVDNRDMKLKPGMTASINIYIEEDSNVLLIPSKALNFKPDSSLMKKFTLIKSVKNKSGQTVNEKGVVKDPEMQRSKVWVKSGDTLTERKIKTALNDDTNIKIISGLYEHEEVVIGIQETATKGQTSTAAKSPFMPQMPKRQGGGSRNR